MNSTLLSVILGAGKAFTTFALCMGAALIFNYAAEQSKAHEHKKYQTILLIITSLTCLLPAYNLYDEPVAGMPIAEKVSFIIIAILCIITFISFILSLGNKS